MISLYPIFYHTFQYKADQCHRTCCVKELDYRCLDEETRLELYQTLPPPLGEDHQGNL